MRDRGTKRVGTLRSDLDTHACARATFALQLYARSNFAENAGTPPLADRRLAGWRHFWGRMGFLWLSICQENADPHPWSERWCGFSDRRKKQTIRFPQQSRTYGALSPAITGEWKASRFRAFETLRIQTAAPIRLGVRLYTNRKQWHRLRAHCPSSAGRWAQYRPLKRPADPAGKFLVDFATMHPAIQRPKSGPDLGHRVLIELHAGVWHAVLYRRVLGPYGEDLEPVREWRASTLAEVTERVEAAAPGVSVLVMVEV